MKANILLLSFFLTASVMFAQGITITKEASYDINYFATTIRGVEQFGSEYIGVKLIEVGRTVGGYPDLPGKDVVLYDFHISVKERTDNSSSTLHEHFWVDGKFHNPRNDTFDAVSKILTFEHGTDENLKTSSLKLSVNGIEIR
ncbi:MAG: hypothetical protein ACFCUU_04885 [Cyclobacteriaceae bacterium]